MFWVISSNLLQGYFWSWKLDWLLIHGRLDSQQVQVDYLTGLLLEWWRYENLGFGDIHFLPHEPSNRESSPAERKLSSNGGRDRNRDRQRGESQGVHLTFHVGALFLALLSANYAQLNFCTWIPPKNYKQKLYIFKVYFFVAMFKLVSTDLLFSTKTPLHTKSWDISVKVRGMKQSILAFTVSL